MELYLISSYTAVCIAVFTILRIPLNRWTVPTASIGGIMMVFTLIQVLNYYHPHSDMSRHQLTTVPGGNDHLAAIDPMAGEKHNLVAWFNQNSLLRLNEGSAVEVAFDGIPGMVFSGEVQKVLPPLVEDRVINGSSHFDPQAAQMQPLIPVLINITDPRYAKYELNVPNGSNAQAAIYGEQLQDLALVRKTLLRMSAWMNYLSISS